MAWVAEILRKDHRVCSRCRVGPTHIYDPPLEAPGDEPENLEAEPAGTMLCQACLSDQLAADLAAFRGRALVFEPALGPEGYLFRSLATAGPAWLPPHRAAVESALGRVEGPCGGCGGSPSCLWVPVAADAGLWEEDLLAALAEGHLAPTEVLCGTCAARRIAASLEERGLFLDAIVPPRGGDGVLVGSAL